MRVYWSVCNTNKIGISPLRYQEPTSSTKDMYDRITDIESNSNQIKRCPAIRNYHENVFSLKFPIDYYLSFRDDTQVSTNMYDQEFFNNFFFIRSLKDRLFSLKLHYIFVTEESCVADFFPAINADNDFVNSTNLLSGRWDIGKWYRSLDCAFFLKEGVKEITIKEGMPYCYVRFNTDEPIEFIRFDYTNNIKDLMEHHLTIKKHINIRKYYPISWYYKFIDKVNYNAKIIKEINNNLI